MINKQKRGCVCGRHYTDQWQRWRVLRRAAVGKASTLYCLDCRREWTARAKYIVLLPDHTKASRTGMTDEDVLAMLLGGRLAVNTQTAEVFGPAGRTLSVVHREHKHGPQRGVYRFVSVCRDGKKKKVALHRLVWMAAHECVVPEGCDVDHIEDQFDDTIGNLRLLSSSENRSLGAAKANSTQGQEAPF